MSYVIQTHLKTWAAPNPHTTQPHLICNLSQVFGLVIKRPVRLQLECLPPTLECQHPALAPDQLLANAHPVRQW